MRAAAWALTIVSGLACAWFAAAAAMLIVPGMDGAALADPYYAVSAARFSLLPALLGLANGVGALLLLRRRRPGALWIALFAGSLALACALWHYLASHAPARMRVPDYMDGQAIAALQRDFILRALLGWGALGFTIAGWGAWLVNRRIAIGHGRD